jgi:hypothetical protein
METTLIQRGKFNDRDYKTGIDSIVKFDYMGSSEFEWGALPDSLDRIRKNINEYTYLDVPIKDKVVSVFCKESQKSDIKLYLTELSEGKWHLQEYSDFDNWINPTEYSKNKDVSFWWDIANDVMFWKKSVEFETKFKSIINKKPEEKS